MTTIEIARRLASLDQRKDACEAYYLALQQVQGQDPAAEMEAALYIFQSGGDYKIPYTCFRDLYNRGCFHEELLPLMTQAFYEPNIRLLKSHYEKNCKLLLRYPYLFRKSFLAFEDLPIRFFPFDDNGYIPYYVAEDRFGSYTNFKNPVISRNFFKDLENPVLADDVYSQYEIEYLSDNVRPSEYVGRENHIYLHYTDWGVFCAHLQCINLRPALLTQKIVFLIEDEISQYPIDFKARYGIDYSQYSVRPLAVREINRMIWHTQLSTHNGGDFFNEIFDSHPNLLCMPSIMFDDVLDGIQKIRKGLDQAGNLNELMQTNDGSWKPRLLEELYRMKDRTDKDLLVAIYLHEDRATNALDANSRIVPAIFFQPHFAHITYRLEVDEKGRAMLVGKHYEEIRKSPVFRGFKYIKTFTPMRRATTSHGATVKFMFQTGLEDEQKESASEKKNTVVSDAISERILNRSFMIDWQDRLYKDCVLVRFEDGKLNPKATFTALAAFLDLPYTESMTYCSLFGERDAESYEGNVRGFDPTAIYRTYDEYVNDDERYFIEFFLRDVYEYYGYSFHYYDGAPVDEERAENLIKGFSTIDYYIRESWRKVYESVKISKDGERLKENEEKTIQEQMLESQIQGFNDNRLRNAKVLLKGLRFINWRGQPLHLMPRLELDPALLERPLYH